MKGSAMVAAVMAIGMMASGLAGCSDPAGKLTSSNPDEVLQAIRAVAQRGTETDVDLLVDMTANQDELLAREAVRGIGSIQRPKAVEALRTVAKGETRETVRAEAVLQLARKPDAETADLLRKIVLVDPGPTVRSAAVAGLETVRSFKDLPLLVEVAQKDGDVAVQSRAVDAVERFVGVRFGYDRTKSGAERQAVIERMAAAVMTLASHTRVDPDPDIKKKP